MYCDDRTGVVSPDREMKENMSRKDIKTVTFKRNKKNNSFCVYDSVADMCVKTETKRLCLVP